MYSKDGAVIIPSKLTFEALDVIPRDDANILNTIITQYNQLGNQIVIGINEGFVDPKRKTTQTIKECLIIFDIGSSLLTNFNALQQTPTGREWLNHNENKFYRFYQCLECWFLHNMSMLDSRSYPDTCSDLAFFSKGSVSNVTKTPPVEQCVSIISTHQHEIASRVFSASSELLTQTRDFLVAPEEKEQYITELEKLLQNTSDLTIEEKELLELSIKFEKEALEEEQKFIRGLTSS